MLDQVQGPSALTAIATEGGLAVSGELDVTTSELFSQRLNEVVSATQPGEDITLYLAGLSFIDSYGVALIAEAAGRLNSDARLVLSDAPPTVTRIAKILGFHRIPNLVIQERKI